MIQMASKHFIKGIVPLSHRRPHGLDRYLHVSFGEAVVVDLTRFSLFMHSLVLYSTSNGGL